MLGFIKRLFTDETAFTGYVRAGIFGLGAAVSTGLVDITKLGLPKWSVILLFALGGFVRAGDKNPK